MGRLGLVRVRVGVGLPRCPSPQKPSLPNALVATPSRSHQECFAGSGSGCAERARAGRPRAHTGRMEGGQRIGGRTEMCASRERQRARVTRGAVPAPRVQPPPPNVLPTTPPTPPHAASPAATRPAAGTLDRPAMTSVVGQVTAWCTRTAHETLTKMHRPGGRTRAHLLPPCCKRPSGSIPRASDQTRGRRRFPQAKATAQASF